MGSVLIGKDDIKIQGCVNPKITKMQWSGHRGEDKWDLNEDENNYLIDNYGGLGTDYLDEIVETGRGAWVFITVQDQETEYTGIVTMSFGEIIQEGNEKTFEGVMTKKSDITVSFDARIISASAIAAAPDKGWIRLTIPKESVKFEGGVKPVITGGTNYESDTNMLFKLFSEDEEQRWVSERNGALTYEELIKQVQSNVKNDRKFLYMTIQFTDNGKKYTANVSTSFRDFFGDDPQNLADGSHSYSAVLYETE